MSGLDTFKYNPVTLVVGCGFVAAGCWMIFELVLHGVRTVAGAIFISVFFVLIPIGL